MVHRNKNDITKALEENLEIIKPRKEEVSLGAINHDTENDVEFSRKHIKDLIKKSSEAINNMMALAAEAEHPRAFEVLSNMIKQSGEMSQELVKLQKLRKEITQHSEKTNGALSSTTNNAIFVGSTSELQKFLRNNEQAGK